MLLHSAVWKRSEEICVSSGQCTSITLLGLTQKMKVISFSISCINKQYVPFSLMLLFLLWWVILFLTEQSLQENVKIHIIVHSIIINLSAETGDCCEKQCMAGFCSVRNTAPNIQSNTQGSVKLLYWLWGHCGSDYVLTGKVEKGWVEALYMR